MRSSIRLLSAHIKAAPKPQVPRSRLQKNTPPPLSLDHFLQRQRVIALYRSIIRSLYRIPKDRRAEPVAHARAEFERNKNVQDIGQIRYLVSTGKTEFEAMERYVDELAARR